jgi:hypothetical protein
MTRKCGDETRKCRLQPIEIEAKINPPQKWHVFGLSSVSDTAQEALRSRSCQPETLGVMIGPDPNGTSGTWV